MTAAILQTNRPKTSSNPTDPSGNWIQAPLTHYRSAHVGNEWQLYLVESVTSTSASQASANLFHGSLSELFGAIAAETDINQLLSGWLTVAEDTFSFWDNALDAAYDEL